MRPPRRRAGGFTVIELLIAMTVLLILMLLGMPALMRMLERQKAYGAATELTALMRLARLEAIKRGQRCGVAVDYPARTATGFVDTNGNDLVDPGEETFGQVVLPKNIEFWGPGDGAPGGADASIGFPEDALEGSAIFDSTGAARVEITATELWGAFRLKARDQNFFEVRIASPITGRVEARKWMGGTEWWVNGQAGKAWRWFDTGETPAPPT
jgi:prepilin-type N-terminal cleavage/methylation domain-containing protein